MKRKKAVLFDALFIVFSGSPSCVIFEQWRERQIMACAGGFATERTNGAIPFVGPVPPINNVVISAGATALKTPRSLFKNRRKNYYFVFFKHSKHACCTRTSTTYLETVLLVNHSHSRRQLASSKPQDRVAPCRSKPAHPPPLRLPKRLMSVSGKPSTSFFRVSWAWKSPTRASRFQT